MADVPKIMASTLDEHREQMRERIFTSFAELLRTQGYDGITLAHVAADAGLSRTAMYNYYRDKESLLIAYTAHRMGRYVERMLEDLAMEANPIGMLRAFIRLQIVEMVTAHMPPSSLTNLVSDIGRSKLSAHVAPVWGTLRSILVDAIAGGYLPACDVDQVLPLVSAVIVGRRPVAPSQAELDAVIASTTTFILRGLGAQLDKNGNPRRATTRQRATGTSELSLISSS